ncbi:MULTISPECIES: alpha/beta hydrolase [Mycolicibacterium]|nr:MULTISPECIES: alpha/beta hydrolase [Mycolicibacterium]
MLFGETADAADKQFAMLFDGDYAVDKLVDGLAAMGDGANYFGTEIEYNKLSIIVGLILAAAEISWCLANAGPTAGASLSAIPAVEMTTAALIRRLIMEALQRILMQMRAMLTRTGIKTLLPHMLKEAFKETGQELAQGLLQEGIVQGIQAQEGHADYRWDRFRQTAIASAVGGGAGGASAVPVGFGLSGSRTKLGNRLAGVTTMFTAGITGNIAGSLSVGGGLDTVSILAGATSTSIGGVKGMGGRHTNGNDTENGPNNGPTDPPSQTEPTGPTPDDLADLEPDTKADESPEIAGKKDDVQDDNEGGQSSGGSRATPTSTNTTSVKGAVAQHDPSAPAQSESANQKSANDDSPTTTSPESAASHSDDVSDRANQERAHAAPDGPHHADDPSTQSPEHTATTREASDQPHHPPEQAAPESSVTDSPAAQDGPAPENHDPTTADMSTVAEPGPESTIAPAADTTVDTTQTTQAQHPVNPAAQSPVAPANAAATTPVSHPPAAPATPTTPAPKPAAPAAPLQSREPTEAKETSKVSGENQVSAASSAVASPSENAGIPAARVQDSVATSEQSAPRQGGENSVAAARVEGADTVTDNHNEETPTNPTAETPSDNRPPPNVNCANNVANQLTDRYRRFGRIFRIGAEPTSRGVRARALFEAAGSSAEFATYADIEARLKSDELGPGSAAIITSAWAGGPDRGGHAYLAVNDGDGIYLLDGETGERLGWPPSWGEPAVSLTAVGYLDAQGNAVSSASDGPTRLSAADEVGYVRGRRDDGGDTSNDGERAPGDRWRDTVSQDRRAETALGRRVPPLDHDHVDELRNPLGSMEAADARARSNATWWAGLGGDEQRALIDTYPRHIGNAEGIPADARHAANKRALDQSRRQLQSFREDGHRLSRSQRKLLARLDRIDQALSRSDDLAQQANVGGPRLLAFDPTAFGGGGRAVVSFGADPYEAQSVSWHIPGQGMTIDQIGYCMGDALNHLRSTTQENPELSAASIAWIGYDTPSGLSSWRAAGHSLARQGGANLYSDIRAFNAARDTWAGDDSHFSDNHVFAHSYGSTTASYAGRDGRLANGVRTISLVGSPGAGPVRTASEFGLGDNVYVASSSRDPFTALGGRAPGSSGRIFGIGLGVDPAMETFGGQRVTAEFSSDMDRRQSRGTHNSYYRFANRETDPPVRSESLANFGRIAAGHADRVDTEQYRTTDEQPRRFFGTRERTVEPAAGRPLRLDGEASTRGDRETRRWWNPRWATEGQATDAAAQLEPGTPEQVAQDALTQRGVAAATDLVSPADHEVPVREAVARARRNAEWWAGLSRDQQRALINTYSREIGNAEGIPPMARDEANQKMLRRYLAHRDLLVSRRDNGVALSPAQERYVKLMNGIDAAMRTAERNVEKFGMRDQGPYLLALDPQAFGGVGRAIVSFGANPYTAQSVSWYVPGMSTTIDKLSLITSRAFNQLRSVQQENPDLSVASIAYIGYRAPGSWDAKVLSQRLAREGGEIFCSDISAFNAGRDVFTGDGSHFSGNHVFAHSYGSSTVSHAGSGRRLAEQVRTITLIGSPGAGPMRHASQFGIGDNVFVAASSRDPVTGFGGERPGLLSRFNGRTGQGTDPAMHEFGARRITAEFPAAVDHRGAGSRMTHSLYWAYMDPGTTQVRSESLANFGRIAAGRTDQVDREEHRTIDRRPRRFFGGSRERTFEPAIGRHLRLSDDPNAHHSVRGRHIWNPRFRNSPATATELTESRAAAAEPTLLGLPENALSDVEQERARDRALARTALKAGRVNASDLVSPADHKVPVREAVARARRNARWWAGLSRDQQRALINTYSREIGNAEGIPPMARNEANQKMLRRYLAHRDLLVSRRENGVTLNSAEVRYVHLMHEVDNGLQAAERRLAQLGWYDQGPYLLALDPRAFGGAGRAIVSFGANPYTAQSVSWYVPGMTTNIEKMRAMALRGINQLQSTLQENPDLSAASITYIGYRAPGSWDPRVGFQRMARQGGNIFCSDLLAFNAGRDVFTGNGSHFSGNHVFAHSYGSSTVSHAGSGRRLAGHVRTITMIGSPGAGPLRTARDFGIGDNVFVAASSRDRTTGLGGERPGARGRIFRGMGQGIDPAMDTFRARRITAEFPAVLDHMGAGSRMTHSLYWAYMDPGTSRVRSEALTNFGRIAAGHADQVDTEGHRTLDRRPRRLFPGMRERSVEPALGRPLRLADDPNTYHSVHGRNRWNPNFLRSTNCAQFVVDELNRRYPDRNFVLPSEPSARGVPARSLFQAIASSAQFTTYDEIPTMLEELGIGSSAVLVSR